MKLSVIMTVYDENIKYIINSVKSVLNQTMKSFEFLIIVDNPENIAAINYLKKLNDNRVRLIVNLENRGLVFSLNKGIRQAHGNYIARMDADDICHTTRFEHELNFLKKNNLDLVFTNARCIDESGIEIDKHILSGVDITNQKLIKKILETYNVSVHSSWIASKRVFDSLSGYRDVHFAEDYDFLVRGLISGFKMGYDSEVLMSYRYRLGSISRDNALEQFYVARRIQTSLKSNKIKPIQYFNINNIDAKDKNLFINSMSSFHRFKNDKKISTFVKLVASIILSRTTMAFSINALKRKYLLRYVYHIK